MGGLPEGTVILLFTNIDGSAALLGRLGDRYGEVLSVHRVLLREQFAARRSLDSGHGDLFAVAVDRAALDRRRP